MKRIWQLTCLLGLIASNAFAQTDFKMPVQAKIESGIIEGDYNTQTGIQTYFGVPFAKPPVGELRWKAPVPAEPWSGVKKTKAFGPRPIQAIVFGDMGSRSAGLSEDCLYLNVWSPAKRNTKNLPVLVYFYGGGLFAGDASEPRYDGEAMSKQGIVVVTVNYRLGLFGFYSHPELSAEASYKASGNYGYLDQNLALKWVQKNIAAFGGDPSKVTIAGESAGSASVSVQMASPLSKGLIAGAIGESGAGINPTMSPVPLAQAEKAGVAFAEKAGAKSLKDLRAMSSRELFEIAQETRTMSFSTVVDGYFLPKTLPELFNAKQQSMVPLLLGWNSAEVSGGMFMQGKPYTHDNYVSKVKEVYPTDHETALKLYPSGTEDVIERSATALSSDRFIAYSTWKWFDLHRKNSSQPVYRYLYARHRAPLVDKNVASGLAGGTVKADPNAPKPRPAVGAPHACEIEYCMGNLHLIKDYAFTADDYTVSKTMFTYFANFIKTGNPNGGTLANWPTAAPLDKEPGVMVIDVESKAVKATDEARYEFLDKQYKN
ncbi:carboxylesterase/lipase family protein [Aquirufa sp.]|jgi:para-nitrobenzyl esterase|uniref:carboxylesterase/lipase family protein n=1 Tax=Aquirufa sp. TaxID=2676249 RepID=UPI003783B2B1